MYQDKAHLPHDYYFAIFDAIAEQSAIELVPHLKAETHIICIQGRVPVPIDPPFTRTISYHEIALGALHDFGHPEDWRHLMQSGEKLMQEIVTSKLTLEAPMRFAF